MAYFRVNRMSSHAQEALVEVAAGDDTDVGLLLGAAGFDGSWKVSRLSGGLINFVYRAEKHCTKSVIIKHYKGHMASNPNVLIDGERYFIEKNALQHCHVLKREGLLQTINVEVPELLFCDDDLRCLVLEDCGKDIVSLFEYLRLPDAETGNSTKRIVMEIDAFLTVLSHSSPFAKHSSLPSTLNSCISEATELSKGITDTSFDFDSSRWQRSFFCRGTNIMIEEYVYELFEHRTANLPALQRYIPLVRRAQMNLRRFNEQTMDSLSEFHQTIEKEGLQLTFGDLWPNSIYFRSSLIDSTAIYSQSAFQILLSPVIILDWEFCGYDHPLTDYCHLLAYVVLMQLDAAYNQKKVAQMIDALIECISSKLSSNPSLSVSLDNISVLLCNAAIILEEDRFNFTHGKEAAAANFANFVDIFVSTFHITDFEKNEY